MSKKYTWNPADHALGVAELDKEHELLFRVVNKLYQIMEQEEKDRKWACQEGCKFFEDHALNHFAREEDYMRAIGYSGYDAHKRIHANFANRLLPTIKKELEQTNYSPQAIEHFVGVAGGWLIGHTLTEDQAIVGRSTLGISKIENLPEADFLDAFCDVTGKVGEDMFQFGSELVTDDYGGEAFGRGVYYEQVFDTGTGSERQIVIMAFEEKLLISTLGEAMGVRTDRLDTILLHAMRYTARQYVRRVLDQMPGMAEYQLDTDSVLTYEQFQRVFANNVMRGSLLYDTGYGYIGVVMPKARKMRSGIDVPEQHERAIVEAEEYLKKRQEIESKPKILIVNDSAVVCERMMEHLEHDYDVALAASGPSAVRAIALNRPELMILSYDMKGWDGPKTLEKLAEYETLSGVPVMFSIESNDKPSVRKVKAITPYGYVLTKADAATLNARVSEALDMIANLKGQAVS